MPRLLTTTFLLVLFTLSLHAGHQAPLGRLLAKVYPAMTGSETQLVLVTFADKGPGARALLGSPAGLVSERSLARRAKVRKAGALVDLADVPLERSYVRAVQGIAAVRHELKWFNGVSVLATKRQIDALGRLPFVSGIELVGRWSKKPEDELASPAKDVDGERAPSGTTSLNYGLSYNQNNLMNVPAVHDLGYYGQGVVIGVFDNGFRNPAHVAFDSMTIIAQYDFVDHKVSVVPVAPSASYGSHGVWTLSTIGGYVPGQLIGPAFKSSYILARTENDSSETPIEEDNWAAAIEWADSIGIDVASTSLGYLGYDSPYTSLTAADMNGSTAVITLAADHASSLGIVVVNSAGNQGPGDGVTNTLIAPADGFDVITAGAVTSGGVRSSFSSVGPTTDVPARIKPDIMAMGSGVRAASSVDTVSYVSVSGTSFSCPLSAGVAALLLSANPSLTPYQVREAMRNTANNALSPNNQYGWGIVNALAAINYYGPPGGPHISGRVYNDLNNNAARDPGEPGIVGVAVRLSGALAETTLTDTLGDYSFDHLVVGAYSVDADTVAGHLRAAPPGSYALSIDSLTQNSTGRDFGYVKLGRIAGAAFRDIDLDGAKGPGEPFLAGAVFHLDGPASLRALTDTAGAFEFTGLYPGTYVLAESLQAGWIQTAPASPETIAVAGGTDTTGFLFGSYFPGEYWVLGGWNLLSLPLEPVDPTFSVIYPTASSSPYSYGPGYRVSQSISAGEGYWLKFPSAVIVSIDGDPVYADTVALQTGWNLVGALAQPLPVASILQSPPSVVTSAYFEFNGTAYATSDTLEPHKGYWVKASGPGTITLDAGLAARAVPTVPVREPAPSPLGVLTLTDARGMERDLVIYDATSGASLAYDLPPAPPAGVFDARFASQRSAEFLAGGEGSFAIELASARAVTAVWRPAGDLRASLRTGATETRLAPSQPVTVNAQAGLTLVLGRGKASAVPEAFALSQNYPNPFNPATAIGYTIAAPTHVTITVVSVLGETVATLVDGEAAPGTYQAVWDATGVPSGVYYCRMLAGPFSGVRSMLLMK
jgi:subtilisin family serine protease